jgi:CDP-glycerol glycerophosphotransferase
MKAFFDALEAAGKRNNATVIFRAHLNTGDSINVKQYDHIRLMPSSLYPVAEEFLFVSDLLVTDWSSIAIDYLVLKRPTLFLDVPAPFSKGFTLGPEHRFGEIVDSMGKLVSSIEKYIQKPEAFLEKYEKQMRHTIKAAYGSTLDGRARDRYLMNLKKMIPEFRQR